VRLRTRDGRRSRRPIVLPVEPRAIAAGAGSVWVAEQDGDGGPASLTQIDPETNAVVGRLAVPQGINDVQAGLGAVWVVVRDGVTLLKVDPATRAIVARTPVGPKALRADVGAGAVWVTNHDDDSVSQIDPRTGEVVTIAVGRKPFGLVARGRWVWVACLADNVLTRIDARARRVVGEPVPVGLNPVGVAAGDGSVWVASRADDTVTRVDYR
jgi:virginiamycin B lyase